MTDKQLMDFMQERAIQIWPQRTRPYGPVHAWYAQDVGPPFRQIWGSTLRDALIKMKKAIDDTKVGLLIYCPSCKREHYRGQHDEASGPIAHSNPNEQP